VCVCTCRRVLIGAGYQLSDDEESVVYVTGDADDDDDYDDYDDDDNVTDAVSSSDNVVASSDHCDAVVEEQWC